MKLLIKKLVDGQVITLGGLDFPETGDAVLEVRATGPFADELRAAWEIVRGMPAIRMKWSEPDPADKTGDTMLLKGRDVPKGDVEYPRAVADILSRRFGLFASLAEYG